MLGQAKGDFSGGLILALRGLVLVAAGSALWHWPSGSGVVSFLLAIVAVPLFVVATLASLVAAAAWRNAAFRTLFERRHWRAGRVRNALLALPFLAALLALATGIFLLVGQMFG